MQREYDINHLYHEAQTRWLKPAEVLCILQNYEKYQLTQQPLQKPPSGSLFLLNKKVLKFFRKDGHDWRKKKDGKALAEAHERLKVGSSEALNCYYAHGEHNPNFQRRSYWMLDQEYEHIVLVHYRDVREGTSNTGFVQSSPNSSSLIPGSTSNSTQNLSFGTHVSHSSELPQHSYSPGAVEIDSVAATKSNGVDNLVEHLNTPESEVRLALRRLEEQLSLDEDSGKEVDLTYSQDGSAHDPELLDYKYETCEQAQLAPVLRRPEISKLERCYGGYVGAQDHSNNLMLVKEDSGSGKSYADETADWKDVLSSCKISSGYDTQGRTLYEDPSWQYSSQFNQLSTTPFQDINNIDIYRYSSGLQGYSTCSEYYKRMPDHGQYGMSLEPETRLTIAQHQKFMIQDISPNWGYATEATKVIIVGSFLCDPAESSWSCMFGDTEVPLKILQDGVVQCEAPPQIPGKVALCITSGNRESCSEIREFEYRDKNSSCTYCNSSQAQGSKSSDELLLLVRFVQMLLSDSASRKEDGTQSAIQIPRSLKANDDTWIHVIESLLEGSGTFFDTIDLLLQELLKDKLQAWLSSRCQGCNQAGCSLSKEEQGVIHMVAGLGYEWALNPILSHGISVNFRDINGWTPLHWAARFGREAMVAALIASGAAAGAVTDPNSLDPHGRPPASIAASNGYKGLAGYLSEVALTSHLSALTLEESDISKGSAEVQAEMTISNISRVTFNNDKDQSSLKDTLAAVRNAAQAAARIQAAFRAHSFRKKQQSEAVAAAASIDEYGLRAEDIQGLSALSKLAFGNNHKYNSAALSIQKKFRGWKRRKDFLALRQNVVKIQAHIRGYQVRKCYKVICWAVGILDKVVLRWRRKGAGLRGFRQEMAATDESDEEDILKVFRRQKVDAAVNGAFARVLSMIDHPDAQQQYRRMLERYQQAKGELDGASEASTSSVSPDINDMEKDDMYQFP